MKQCFQTLFTSWHTQKRIFTWHTVPPWGDHRWQVWGLSHPSLATLKTKGIGISTCILFKTPGDLQKHKRSALSFTRFSMQTLRMAYVLYPPWISVVRFYHINSYLLYTCWVFLMSICDISQYIKFSEGRNYSSSFQFFSWNLAYDKLLICAANGNGSFKNCIFHLGILSVLSSAWNLCLLN